MSSLLPLSSPTTPYTIVPRLETLTVAVAGAGASISRSCAPATVTAMREDGALTLGGKRYRFIAYAHETELTEQRMRDGALGFTALDCLNHEALILYQEDQVLINLYSTTLEIPGVSHPCTLVSYLLPRLLFESLQRGLEKQFLHQAVMASHVLTLSCLTLIQEILVAKEHLRGSDDLVDQLELLTLHLSSWLGWIEFSRMRVDRAAIKDHFEEGINAIVHQIIEEERAIQGSDEGVLHSTIGASSHLTSSTLSYICQQLQVCADDLAMPFRPSPPKRASLSTKALAAHQRSQEEILKPLQKLRLELKQTVEAAIWIGSSPKHTSLLLCLPLINIFAVKAKDGRTLLIDSVEKLDAMLEVRAKMQMGKVKRASDLKSYIHASREELESLSMARSMGLKRKKEARFPTTLSLGFALEKRYQGVLIGQAIGLEKYLVRIAPTAAVSEEAAALASASSFDINAIPLHKYRSLLMSQALSLYQMNEAKQFSKMYLKAVDETTFKLRMHSTLGSIGWLEIWKVMCVHEIPVPSDLPPSVSYFLLSTNALLRNLPAIDNSRIDRQLRLLYHAQQTLLNHASGAIHLIYDHLLDFHEIELLYAWTCAMSQHCTLCLNTIKKNEAMTYEEIDQLIFLIESHRLMDLLKVSESLVECYRSFIPLLRAPTYMASAFIALLVELREMRGLKRSEAPIDMAPIPLAAEEACKETLKVALDGAMMGDRAIMGLITDSDAEVDATEEPLDPAIVEAMADVMSGTGYYVETPSCTTPEKGAGAGSGPGAMGVLVAEEPPFISDPQLKSIKDHRHLHRFLRAAGMQCLRENGGSHSTWGAAGVKFTVACHRNQEISPKIRQRILDAVKSAHQAMQREAQEQSLMEVAAGKPKKSKAMHKK